MSLRKHKYKERLAELEQWARVGYADAKAAYENSLDNLDAGRLAVFEELLQKLTLDETKEQALDEAARRQRNAKRSAKRKAQDMRPLWCVECLWTGPAKDALVEDEHICPNCAGEDLKRGVGPRDRGKR